MTGTADAILQQYYAVLRSGDIAAMKGVVSDDMTVVYHDNAGVLPWGGLWSGFDRFLAFLDTVKTYLVIEKAEPDQQFETDGTICVVLNGRWRIIANNASVEARVINVFGVRDGKIQRYEVFTDTAAFDRALKQAD